MKKYVLTATLGLGFVLTAPVSAQTEWTSSRPDGHAPIGVMADHTHERGEFMFSYRFMNMGMEGSLDGTSAVADSEVIRAGGPYGFMVTPTEMSMSMHMLGMMYAPSDRVTLMGMVNYIDVSMGHLPRMGETFSTGSSGIGDVGLTALIGLITEGASRLHFNAGVTFPTGSVGQTDVTPMSAPDEAQLPYPMQLGSGTFALVPGITWLGMSERISWGAQGTGTFQLGENDRGWTVGDRLSGTAWLAYRAVERLSFSARARYQKWNDYSGSDPELNPMMVPTARTDLRGGKRLDLPVGANWWFNDGALRGFRILVEYEIPVWQSLSGPQLKSTGTLTLGAQLSVG